jgi:prolyl 4-hydroxylase
MSFIETYQISDQSLCDKIINWFENNTEKHEGYIENGIVNKEIKDSTDCLFHGYLTSEYGKFLFSFIEEYKAKYPLCSSSVSSWSLYPLVNIQKYEPGGYYKNIHCERSCGEGAIGKRHLVFMTYLNTVNEGGETRFHHQDVNVKPVKGKTLIWPAEWTHSHVGIPAPNETKYIVTGWISFEPHE